MRGVGEGLAAKPLVSEGFTFDLGPVFIDAHERAMHRIWAEPVMHGHCHEVAEKVNELAGVVGLFEI
jgi:hypothetical protein